MNAVNEFAAVHEEFVKVIQGASSFFRFGSDRIRNAEDYTHRHAEAMLTFQSPELHPETCAKYRMEALRWITYKQTGQWLLDVKDPLI